MKLSIDLGGTNIRIAQVEKGNCLNKVSVPCLAQQDASTVLNQLSLLIRNMMNEQVDGIFTRILGKISAFTILQYINHINNKPIGRLKYALI